MKQHLLLFTLAFFCAIHVFGQGTSCSKPIAATADSNNEHTLGQYNYQWFSYTATQDGKIVLENITTDGSAYASIYTNCENYIVDGYNSVSFESTAGQTYYIEWYNYSSENFNWSLREEDAINGEFCSMAISASADTNNEHTFGQDAEQWYVYTATKNGKMVLENLDGDANSEVYVFTGCENYYTYNEYGFNKVTFEITSGTTYYILWNNFNTTNFYWSLSELDLEAGDACSMPIAATADGNNEYTFGPDNYQWYSYTATQDGKMVLENLEAAGDAYVQIYTDCNDNYNANYGYNGITYEITSGVTYYIVWYNYNSTNFNWSLSEEPLEEGEACRVAIPATADSNNQYTFGQYMNQWYSYTATKDGKIVLESLDTDGDAYVQIYTDCDSYYNEYGVNGLTYQITSGTTYYILWYNNISTNFNWSLSEADLEAGDACSVPMAATADDNNEHTFGQYSNQWYSYTATQDGKMVLENLDAEGDAYVQVNTDCDYSYDSDYGYNTITYEITSGVTYYIVWYNYTSTNFNWSLSEADLEAGDACSVPMAATADSNNEYTFGQYSNQWYSYTATRDGKMVLENLDTDAYSYVYVYTDCDSYYIEYGFNEVSFEITSGTTYYILWYNNNSTNFYWSLSETDLEAGEACSVAIPATADSNNEHTFGQYRSQWYSYTATQDGKIVLENLAADAYSYVEVYSDCGEYYTDGDNEIQFESTEGQTYYIVWYNDNSTNFNWSLSEEDLEIGDGCSMPIPATADSNNEYTLGVYYPQWFSYTATQDGKIVIENLAAYADAYAVIYSDCSTYYAYGYNSVTFESTIGQTYYIAWYNYTSTNFYWSLREGKLEAGDVCSMPLTAVLGDNTTDNSSGDQWFIYTPTEDENLIISTCNYTSEDTYVEVYTGCGYGYLDYSDNDCGSQSYLTFSAVADETYYIRWFNYYTTSTFTWNLSIDGSSDIDTDYESKVKMYPNPAKEEVFIDSELPIKYVRILNMQGNMVNEVSGPDSSMRIKLPVGVYFVEIYFVDGGKTIQKLIVK